MNEIKDKLIKAVKTAVAKYGLSGISTRNIADEANVSDSNIYHCFVDKDDMLLQAYMYENGVIFNQLLNSIDEVHKFDIPFRDKAYISFRKVWRAILSNPERITYCVFYYHSTLFKNAEKYHNGQLEELQNCLGKYFPNMDACTHTMYAMCSLLYDSTYSVVSGQEKDTEEYMNRVFEMEMAVMKSQMI